MNKWVGAGRLVKDPDVRYTGDQKAVARFTIAVNRRKKDETDFISCVAFGKQAEFVEKYFHKGMKADIAGRIQTGSYEKDGRKVYTTDIVVEDIEFGESKAESKPAEKIDEGFMDVPDDSELPFN